LTNNELLTSAISPPPREEEGGMGCPPTRDLKELRDTNGDFFGNVARQDLEEGGTSKLPEARGLKKACPVMQQ